MKNFEFRDLFVLSDDQIRHIFDSCRNLLICGAIFTAADWELSQIKPISSIVDVLNSFIFVFLVALGAWLFFINQSQVFRRLKECGLRGVSFIFMGHIYNLVAITLMVSIFLH